MLEEEPKKYDDERRIADIYTCLEIQSKPDREASFNRLGGKLKMSDILYILGEHDIKSSKDYVSLPKNARYLVDLAIYEYFAHLFRQLKRESSNQSLNLIFNYNDYGLLENLNRFLNHSLLYSNIPLYSINCEVFTRKFSDEPGYVIQHEVFSDNSNIIESIMSIKPIIENDIGLILPKRITYAFDTIESQPFEYQLNLDNFIPTSPFHNFISLNKPDNAMFFNINVPGIENIPLSTIIAIKKEYSEDFAKFYKALLMFYLKVSRAQTSLEVKLLTEELNDNINDFRLMVRKLRKIRVLSTATFVVTLITAIVSMIFGVEQINMISSILSGGSLSQVVQSHINLNVEPRRSPYWIILFLEKTGRKYI